MADEAFSELPPACSVKLEGNDEVHYATMADACDREMFLCIRKSLAYLREHRRRPTLLQIAKMVKSMDKSWNSFTDGEIFERVECAVKDGELLEVFGDQQTPLYRDPQRWLQQRKFRLDGVIDVQRAVRKAIEEIGDMNGSNEEGILHYIRLTFACSVPEYLASLVGESVAALTAMGKLVQTGERYKIASSSPTKASDMYGDKDAQTTGFAKTREPHVSENIVRSVVDICKRVVENDSISLDTAHLDPAKNGHKSLIKTEEPCELATVGNAEKKRSGGPKKKIMDIGFDNPGPYWSAVRAVRNSRIRDEEVPEVFERGSKRRSGRTKNEVKYEDMDVSSDASQLSFSINSGWSSPEKQYSSDTGVDSSSAKSSPIKLVKRSTHPLEQCRKKRYNSVPDCLSSSSVLITASKLVAGNDVPVKKRRGRKKKLLCDDMPPTTVPVPEVMGPSEVAPKRRYRKKVKTDMPLADYGLQATEMKDMGHTDTKDFVNYSAITELSSSESNRMDDDQPATDLLEEDFFNFITLPQNDLEARLSGRLENCYLAVMKISPTDMVSLALDDLSGEPMVHEDWEDADKEKLPRALEKFCVDESCVAFLREAARRSETKLADFVHFFTAEALTEAEGILEVCHHAALLEL